jgi:phosphoglycolate phosphatase
MTLVVFDFDGTLYDSEAEVWRTISFQKRFAPELAVIKTRQDLRDIYRGNFYEEVCRWNRMPIKQAPALARRMRKCFVRDYSAPIIPGIKAVIKALSKGFQLAVVSSNYGSAMRKLLRRDGIEKYFVAVSGAESGKSKKDRIVALLKRRHVRPEQAVYVTDTTGDVKESRKAGLEVIAVGWGFHSVAALRKTGAKVIRRPGQLPKIMGDYIGC